MEALRRAHYLARLVLAWFALALGTAAAAPLIHPQAIELICGAGGQIKAVVHTDDGVVEMGAIHLDCALCLVASAPPPAAFVTPPPPPLPALAWATPAPRPLPMPAALPWQARAPPTAS
ncbi:MAG: hypothetical protein Q4G70_00495 [Pseudomonadota bacterium]|nr:hypothetical protein [Pseudomonadota bacterium]